jgi:hypothetical protein
MKDDLERFVGRLVTVWCILGIGTATAFAIVVIGLFLHRKQREFIRWLNRMS